MKSTQQTISEKLHQAGKQSEFGGWCAIENVENACDCYNII